MNRDPARETASAHRRSLLQRLQERGVLRVAASYAVIAWLALQIADVTLEPLGAPAWVMTALVIAAAAGFPLALVLAWFLEIGEHGIEIDTAADGVARPRTRGLRHYADALVIGVLLVTVVVLLVRQSDLAKPKAPENPAIAVLPFENLSGDPEQEYFSDGLAEEMLDRLARVPGLRVVSRSSSFSFKGMDLQATAIAEKLGVTTLLEGSIRRSGSRLRLSARLIDGSSGQQTWSGSFDRELQDVFAVQAELAGAIVEAIVPAARGTAAESPAAPTTDLSAYDLYLAARAQLALRLDTSVRKAVELSEQAVRLDPAFARAQAQLATALGFAAMYDADNPTFMGEDEATLQRRAETAIHKALALDPELSEAHGAWANLLRNINRPGAEEAYRRALELNPNNAAIWHDYAVYLANDARRYEESGRAAERALELDPRQPATWSNRLATLDVRDPLFRREFERALQSVGDMPFALDRFTMPELAIAGFPVEVMEAAVLKKRNPFAENLPLWINRARAWLAVDPARAWQRLPAQATEPRPGVDLEVVRLLLEADIAGLSADWPELDGVLARLRERPLADTARVHSVQAFWYAVQGRDAEAAPALAAAEPIPEYYVPPAFGADANHWLMETAKLRILRATGREEEAARFVEPLLVEVRAQRKKVGDGCMLPRDQGGRRYTGWMRHASLAASEGLREEAVDALQGAMRCGELPPTFQPQFPWFVALDGLPAYEALKRERKLRIARLRSELERIEQEAGFVAMREAPAG